MKTIPTSDGICTGRNGTFEIKAIELNHFGDVVRIDAWSKRRGTLLNAGISFDRNAAKSLADELRAILEGVRHDL